MSEIYFAFRGFLKLAGNSNIEPKHSGIFKDTKLAHRIEKSHKSMEINFYMSAKIYGHMKNLLIKNDKRVKSWKIKNGIFFVMNWRGM
jgi:hypothetical protein